MTTVKHAPDQKYLPTKEPFDWESEATLVDQRNRLPYRILRFFTNFYFWLALIAIFLWALFDAQFMSILITVGGFAVQILLIMAIFVFQFVMMFWFLGRPRQYTIMPGDEGVGFKDYRGQPEILEHAQQIVTLLRGVKAFEGAGGEPLNGLLLEGPPGTGKTWLAQAISTEAGVPFFYVDTSSLQGMFMGTSSIKVASMYAKARKAAKEYGAAVIFLDEIDAIGSRAGVSAVGGGLQQPPGGMGGMGGDTGMLNTMLSQMSGFSLEHGFQARVRTWFYKTFLRRLPPKPEKRVLTIGATNRIQALDPALLRPGRFDKKLRIDAPDAPGRKEIFEYYLSKMAHDESMDPVLLASETPYYTPADIKYLLNEALRFALFAGRRYMTYTDFQLAKPEHEMGTRNPIKHMSKEARERLAYHEAGHAVAVRIFQPHHRITRITIIRQGAAFGHVRHYPARESFQGLNTRDEYYNALRVSVAGKAAEMEFCGEHNQTLGVGGDFVNIRYWLNLMARAGMLGPLGGSLSMRIKPDGTFGNLPPEMLTAMEDAYQSMLNDTRRALRERSAVVRELVVLLLAKEELLAEEVKIFFDQHGLPTPEVSLIYDREVINLLPPATNENSVN